MDRKCLCYLVQAFLVEACLEQKPSLEELGSQHACWTDHQIALVAAQLLDGHHDFATSAVTLPKVVLGSLAVHWTHLQICFLPELRLENQKLGWDEHGLHTNLLAHLVVVLGNLHESWIGLRSKLAHTLAGFAPRMELASTGPRVEVDNHDVWWTGWVQVHQGEEVVVFPRVCLELSLQPGKGLEELRSPHALWIHPQNGQATT